MQVSTREGIEEYLEKNIGKRFVAYNSNASFRVSGILIKRFTDRYKVIDDDSDCLFSVKDVSGIDGVVIWLSI